ncbi:hypothetical protein [Sinorhizobium alkalisoli]|nr:hypothetical protein [Sinorhizobium alkalisoli]QFI70497.1 hypothetical protein EKH55_5623 [Sinorhizobium alkalisoli]
MLGSPRTADVLWRAPLDHVEKDRTVEARNIAKAFFDLDGMRGWARL